MWKADVRVHRIVCPDSFVLGLHSRNPCRMQTCENDVVVDERVSAKSTPFSNFFHRIVFVSSVCWWVGTAAAATDERDIARLLPGQRQIKKTPPPYPRTPGGSSFTSSRGGRGPACAIRELVYETRRPGGGLQSTVWASTPNRLHHLLTPRAVERTSALNVFVDHFPSLSP